MYHHGDKTWRYTLNVPCNSSLFVRSQREINIHLYRLDDFEIWKTRFSVINIIKRALNMLIL